jgi:hypothetical protein
MASILHHGPFNETSRANPTLNFIEKYACTIDSLDLSSTPPSSFFSPFAVYHDTKGDVHISAPQIWSYMARQFVPFSQIRHAVQEIRVVPEEEGRDVVYCETLTHFRLHGDEEEIVVPRFFVWVVGKADEGMGTDGRWILETRMFWDTGVIGRYVTEKKKEERLRAKG